MTSPAANVSLTDATLISPCSLCGWLLTESAEDADLAVLPRQPGQPRRPEQLLGPATAHADVAEDLPAGLDQQVPVAGRGDEPLETELGDVEIDAHAGHAVLVRLLPDGDASPRCRRRRDRARVVSQPERELG